MRGGIALVLQHARDEFADVLLVVDDQYVQRHGQPIFMRVSSDDRLSPSSGVVVLGGERRERRGIEGEPHDRAAAGAVGEGDRAEMLLDDLA